MKTPHKTEMDKLGQIAKLESDRPRRNLYSIAVAMTLIIAAAVLMLPSCQRKPVMAHSAFVHLPVNGWLRTVPLRFQPEYDDSALTYSLTLAVRHDISFPYRNLSLVVDIFAADSVVTRKTVSLELADQYGNWTGGGFGSLYQDTINVAGGVSPDDASSIVVWQAMPDCDTLRGLVDVGFITRPLN